MTITTALLLITYCPARDVKQPREAGITIYGTPMKEPNRTLWLNVIQKKIFTQSRMQLFAASSS